MKTLHVPGYGLSANGTACLKYCPWIHLQCKFVPGYSREILVAAIEIYRIFHCSDWFVIPVRKYEVICKYNRSKSMKQT